MFYLETETIWKKRQATGSIHLISSFFFIISRSSYIIVQSSFTTFSPKIFRVTDMNINPRWKYNIIVISIQFLIQRISVVDILYVSNIWIFKSFCFLTVHAGYDTVVAGVTVAPPTLIFLLDNYENHVFIGIHWKSKEGWKKNKNRSQTFLK